MSKKTLQAIWLGVVYACFLGLLLVLRLRMPAPDGDPALTWRLGLSLADAALFTLPLVWLRPRWRWTLYPVLVLLGVYVVVNVNYFGRYANMMGYDVLTYMKNMDPMVVKSMTEVLNARDFIILVFVLLPPCAWFGYFRRRLRGEAFPRPWAHLGTIGTAGLFIVAQIMAFVPYAQQRNRSQVRPVASLPAMFWQKLTQRERFRVQYFRNNGLWLTMLYNLDYYTGKATLTASEKTLVEQAISETRKVEDALGCPVRKDSLQRNLLIVMVESLESWPIGLTVNGHAVTPVIDSLLRLPQTLYYPNVMSQISLGTSSDGHLMTLTGLPPATNYPWAFRHSQNTTPSLIHALNARSYNTLQITGDESAMWNQGETTHTFGFTNYFNLHDVDPKGESFWSTRDYYIMDYTGRRLATARQPFAAMMVTLSLHSPYHNAVRGFEHIKSPDYPPGSTSYLQMVAFDDKRLGKLVNALQRAGRFDNTTIVITGDHVAAGLSDAARPRWQHDKLRYIPLIIVNSGFEKWRNDAVAGQIDIYPTLLDVMQLDSYPWRGLGRSMLRGMHGATNVLGQYTGPESTPPAERLRQLRVLEAAQLIHESDYFGGN